jgi:hypothetical protein
MSTARQSRHEVQQLRRLRGLRVQRAQAGRAVALAEERRAAEAVRDRHRLLETCRGEIHALDRAMVHALAPQLPRWATLVLTHRDGLTDRLERGEDALIGDEQRLDSARCKSRDAGAALVRARARENTVRDLGNEMQRAHSHCVERGIETELEDQGCARRVR